MATYATPAMKGAYSVEVHVYHSLLHADTHVAWLARTLRYDALTGRLSEGAPIAPLPGSAEYSFADGVTGAAIRAGLGATWQDAVAHLRAVVLNRTGYEARVRLLVRHCHCRTCSPERHGYRATFPESMMAKDKIELIDPDGSRRAIVPANGRRLTYDERQALVGGYPCAFRLRDGRHMIVDDDFLSKGLAPNRTATRLAIGCCTLTERGICGPVIVGNARRLGL